MTKHTHSSHVTATPRICRIGVGEVVIRGSITQGLIACEAIVRAAAHMQVEAIFFSETALSGYHYALTDTFVCAHAEEADGRTVTTLQDLSNVTNMCIGLGFWEKNNGTYFNSYAICQPHQATTIIRKHNLTDLEQSAGITPGPVEGRTFTINGINAGLAICADVGSSALIEHLRDQAIELMVLPTGGGALQPSLLIESDLDTESGLARFQADRERLCQTKALVHHPSFPCDALVTTNALGPVGDDSYHWGQSQIIDQRGIVRAQIPGTTVHEHMQDGFTHALLRF